MPPLIQVLYEDDDLIVFEKPSGLLVIPSPKKEKNTLVQIVNKQFASYPNECERGKKDRGKLHPCHRLDRDTSGAIIFAKGKKNQQLMMQEFRQGAVKKKYIAFVKGQMSRQQGEIRSAICDFHQQKYARARRSYPTGRKAKLFAERRGQRILQPSSQMAVTRYKVKAAEKHFSVIEVFPKTGRTNQIRIHLSEKGHPLLGERLYAFGKDFFVKFPRVALHALELSWRHPVHQRQIKVVSDLPRDMKQFIAKSGITLF